jgi:hypothetical protein
VRAGRQAPAPCARSRPWRSAGHSCTASSKGALNRFAVHLTKLRYDARASISFADNLLATPGIGGAAAA